MYNPATTHPASLSPTSNSDEKYKFDNNTIILVLLLIILFLVYTK